MNGMPSTTKFEKALSMCVCKKITLLWWDRMYVIVDHILPILSIFQNCVTAAVILFVEQPNAFYYIQNFATLHFFVV